MLLNRKKKRFKTINNKRIKITELNIKEVFCNVDNRGLELAVTLKVIFALIEIFLGLVNRI